MLILLRITFWSDAHHRYVRLRRFPFLSHMSLLGPTGSPSTSTPSSAGRKICVPLVLVLANRGLRELALMKLRAMEVIEADGDGGGVSSCSTAGRLAGSASPEPVGQIPGDLRALPTALKIPLSISGALPFPLASSSAKLSGVCISERALFRLCAACFFLEVNVQSAGRGLGIRLLLLLVISADGGLGTGEVLIDDDPEECADVIAELDVKASV